MLLVTGFDKSGKAPGFDADPQNKDKVIALRKIPVGDISTEGQKS